MEPTAAAIEKIVRAIVDEVHPTRVILFGSIARGESSTSSDVDLLIVVREGTHRRYGDRIGLIYRTALAEGRVLYAA